MTVTNPSPAASRVCAQRCSSTPITRTPSIPTGPAVASRAGDEQGHTTPPWSRRPRGVGNRDPEFDRAHDRVGDNGDLRERRLRHKAPGLTDHGLGACIISHPGPALARRRDPRFSGRHALTCTPILEEPLKACSTGTSVEVSAVLPSKHGAFADLADRQASGCLAWRDHQRVLSHPSA